MARRLHYWLEIISEFHLTHGAERSVNRMNERNLSATKTPYLIQTVHGITYAVEQKAAVSDRGNDTARPTVPGSKCESESATDEYGDALVRTPVRHAGIVKHSMKKHAPQVGQYMTHLPVEAERCETLADAIALMDKHGIHHIPVMNGSQLKGVVSLSDILRLRAQRCGEGDDVPLEDACRSDVYTVGPLTPVDDVARGFLQRQTDAAVVMDGGFVVGICTITDILRFVGEYFGQASA